MSTITKPITVDEYDRMVEDGTIPEDGRVELIEGQLVEKMTQGTKHTTAAEKCRRVIERLVMAGWHVRIERPVRIPERDSEPEPDLAVVRGDVDDYDDHHPGTADVALVVEVARSSLADDRALAQTYGGGGIPVYWIVNVDARQLEVYAHPVPGARAGGTYPPPTIMGETESVALTIGGQLVGRIAVADLLPRRP
jgi:Uma2 family endonuclease